MGYTLSDLTQLLISEHGEAVHLHPNEAPVLEVKRTLYRIEGPPLAAEETTELLSVIAPPEEISKLKTDGLSSFYFRFGDEAVFQVMAFRENDQVRLELRRFR